MLARLIVTGRDRTHALDAPAGARGVRGRGRRDRAPFHRAVTTEPRSPATRSPCTHARSRRVRRADPVPGRAGPRRAGGAARARTPHRRGRRTAHRGVVTELVPAAARRSPPAARFARVIAYAPWPPRRATPWSPHAGVIRQGRGGNGRRVEEGDLVMVVKAMKSEQQACAHRGGTVADLTPAVGDTLSAGAPISGSAASAVRAAGAVRGHPTGRVRACPACVCGPARPRRAG